MIQNLKYYCSDCFIYGTDRKTTPIYFFIYFFSGHWFLFSPLNLFDISL